jgi:hypothetical protein
MITAKQCIGNSNNQAGWIPGFRSGTCPPMVWIQIRSSGPQIQNPDPDPGHYSLWSEPESGIHQHPNPVPTVRDSDHTNGAGPVNYVMDPWHEQPTFILKLVSILSK